MQPESEIPRWLVATWVAVVGASLGSFLNVVVARLPAGQSIVRPRSRCPRCLAPIAWFDNLPVLSWLLLRGRCRACRDPIAMRYPLVELAGAAAALLALRRHGFTGAAAAEVALVLCLLALSLIDLDTWLLPNALTWPLLGGGLLAAAAGLAPAPSLSDAALGAAIGWAAFAAIAVAGERLFRREAMGWGDVWLLSGLGAWLGVKALLPVVLLASLQGTAVGLVLAGLGRLPKGGRDASSTPTPAADSTSSASSPTTATATQTGGEGSTEAVGLTRSETDEEEWVPPRNAVPFGPFLAAAGLEWLYLADALARLAPLLDAFR